MFPDYPLGDELFTVSFTVVFRQDFLLHQPLLFWDIPCLIFFPHTCLIKISKIKSLFRTPYWQSPFNVSSFLPYSFFSSMQLFYYVQIMLFSYHILIFLITNYMWGYISFRNINVKRIIFKHFLKTANSISGLWTLS